ncbi:hypothetical protein Airi01_028990 [Actinoallomurus iriomotensis]|nr:hypothetical protein Airi01_028990 [Actinoallomurus iriomotensis]
MRRGRPRRQLTTEPDRARDTIARDFTAVGDMPAYRASLDRAGLSGPADTVVVGDESVIVDALARFRDASATDVIVSPLGSLADRARTLDVAGGFSPRESVNLYTAGVRR